MSINALWQYPRTPSMLTGVFLLSISTLGFSNPIQDGTLLFDARLRMEAVDDDGLSRDANAVTLRTRLGWKTASYHGFHAVIEAEDIRALDNGYNSTANGRTSYPVVVDPKGSEWNQAYVGWDSGQGALVQVGRQRLAYDNQRFIGNVGWRQNEQTFDAASLRWQIDPQWLLQYAWLDKVHRVFGNQHPNPLQAENDLDAHLLNSTWQTRFGGFTGYAYLIDNEDIGSQSARTFGLRHQRTLAIADALEWWYAVELATQQGWRRAPETGSVEYFNAEAGIRRAGHGLRIGFEQLDSNGQRAFQTPLATAHAFNGWADRFLITPSNGLNDLYLKIDGPVGNFRYLVAYHRFTSARNSTDFGHEFNAQISWPFAKGWNALAKYADYHADNFGRDVQKLWLSVEYRK